MRTHWQPRPKTHISFTFKFSLFNHTHCSETFSRCSDDSLPQRAKSRPLDVIKISNTRASSLQWKLFSLQREPSATQVLTNWPYSLQRDLSILKENSTFPPSTNTTRWVMFCCRLKLHLPWFKSFPFTPVKRLTPPVQLMGSPTALYNQTHFINIYPNTLWNTYNPIYIYIYIL